MPPLSMLPVDVLLEIFQHLDLYDVLSLRQLSTTWTMLIDGEDVSRFFLNHPSFTFCGRLLKEQHEAIRRPEGTGYQIPMRHLSSRLRGLHSEGPTFLWSLPHPSENKFCYGDKFLALEIRKGEEVEIRDASSQRIVFSISLSSILEDSKPFHCRHIIDMRIQESVLLISVNEIKSIQGPLQYRHQDWGINTLLFFALSSLDSRLLLKIPRRRSKEFVEPVSGEDETNRLCEFNANMAVIGTPHFRFPETVYSLNVWNLDTGELTMGNIPWEEDLTAMSITGPTDWAILSVFSSDPPPYKTLASALYSIYTFTGMAPPRRDVMFKIRSFPNDFRIRDAWLNSRRHVRFGITEEHGNRWGIIWRQINVSGGKVRLFQVDNEGTVVARRLFASSCMPMWNKIHVDLSFGYVVGPSLESVMGCDGELSYLWLRDGAKAKMFSNNRYDSSSTLPESSEGLTICSSETVYEHWIGGDEREFQSSKSTWHKSRIKTRSAYPTSNGLDVYGDDEFFVCRAGELLRLYSFDAYLKVIDEVHIHSVKAEGNAFMYTFLTQL